MILLDPRMGGGDKAKQEKKLADFLACFKRSGVPTESYILPFGDACFEGSGPRGTISVGVELKTLHDMLHCIDDARYVKQRTGMSQLYGKSFLIVEGHWKPHDPNGSLMEGFQGGTSWGDCRYRSQRVMYSKLYRYLLSVSLSGVTVTYSRDMFHTAYNICEIYHYFQKPWHRHTSMLETQVLSLPSLYGPPSLCREWAARIDGVGVIKSIEAEKVFRTAANLANAEEREWLQVPGIGPGSAKKIVRQIWEGK